MTDTWPNGPAVTQVRVSRPTDRLAEVVEYWAENGGIAFEDPDGWRVVFMPDKVF